ncbi:anthrax toxin-like adenylyl cyclase domain-containing protein [Rugamonas sp.]|uniref:anthrax toxin-like adenylyl cyclase domain-containing protein n=1 Tax=Rugamonas sp. TaxID=1926287 RepID=UPI002601538B|nr:anthrax toxin-like adenylyl cyclase domain-containing protein [Rugamonas sp.]
MLIGLSASFSHNQNGMTRLDMEATKRVAERLNEVIIFRSTGPWSKRWLEDNYPSKNFHVKGKSSDWGPHAGLVPHNGLYSKVGYDAAKAAKGTQANNDGLASGFAGKQPLVLTQHQIDQQLNRTEGSPARSAIDTMMKIPGSTDTLLLARRSGDAKSVVFRACARPDGRFEIRVYPPVDGKVSSPFLVLDKDPKGLKAELFEVMTSNEAGAGLPMTGDYDLFAICPSWAQYGSQAPHDIVKPGIQIAGGPLHKGLAFRAGQGMDNVIDPTLHTMSEAGDFASRKAGLEVRAAGGMGPLGRLTAQQHQAYFAPSEKSEHGDMGNLTPRILRCINELNVAMGAVGPRAALRRVHHNAESHRNRAFGALTRRDMVTMKDGDQYGDGFPLTVFQPSTLYTGNALNSRWRSVARYGDVSTLETLAEFNAYAQALGQSDYYVPKNWIWSA